MLCTNSDTRPPLCIINKTPTLNNSFFSFKTKKNLRSDIYLNRMFFNM